MPCTKPPPEAYDPAHPHMGCTDDWCVDDLSTPQHPDPTDREAVRRAMLRIRHLRATGQTYHPALLARVERAWDRVK